MTRSPTTQYVVRAATTRDLAAFVALKALAGPGFTSLSVSDDELAARLHMVEESFAADVRAPGDQRYMLALEHSDSGEVVGMAQVKATVGVTQPFFNFRILQIAQASFAAQRRFDLEVLILVNECTGCSEVGSLFVREDHRVGGLGRLLAQSRYLLMAAAPQRFAERVVSELRGVMSADGVSPFWEHLGRHFFRMSFAEADHLSATTDNQFILDLMPKYPIYVDLLPEAARAVIGKCHRDGGGARKLLEWEGFRYDRIVDIFDGGPLMAAPREAIRTLKGSRRLPVKIGAPRETRSALVANLNLAMFRCASAVAEITRDHITIAAEDAARLGLAGGDAALAWAPDAA
jgi:arginine N-succinyltransferase